MNMDEQILFVVQNKRFPRTFEIYSRYGVLIGPLGFLGAGTYLMYRVIAFNETHVQILGLVFTAMGLFLSVFTWKRLNDITRFHELITGLNASENLTLAKNVLLEELHLKEESHSEPEYGLVVAHTAVSLTSWGEEVSIVCLDGRVLINSLPSQPITIFRDSQNVRRVKEGFKKHL